MLLEGHGDRGRLLFTLFFCVLAISASMSLILSTVVAILDEFKYRTLVNYFWKERAAVLALWAVNRTLGDRDNSAS